MNARAALQARRPERSGLPEQHPIRLLIVDDSSVARAVLSRMVGAQRDFEVAGTAGSVIEALAQLRDLTVDVVLLDVDMPGVSGLEALPVILKTGRGARVMVVSSMAEAGAETSVKALALGAADAMPKPGASAFAGRFAENLAERLRRIGRRTAPARSSGESAPLILREVDDWTPECVAIGASTGGILAIHDLLAGLKEPIGAPILVTQHLPELFMPHFARQLEKVSGRVTKVAQNGDQLRPEHIYVAPGKAHLCVERTGSGVRVKLDARAAPSGCLPSLDPMLVSVGEAYGRGGVAVVLSGMGRDGAAGSHRLVEAGGVVLAQDQFSSSIWGMPRAVAEAGIATAVAPPRELARCIAARTGSNTWK